MMKQAALRLTPGRVYRTRDFAAWSANAPRLANRLVRDGRLVPLAHGLFARLRTGRFGPTPPTDTELMRAFLNGTPFVFTGPDRWNALGLNTTASAAIPRVYNKKRSGMFTFGGRVFDLHRIRFPKNPTPEWFVIDLIEHAEQAGASRADLAAALTRAVRRQAFVPERLRTIAARYGTKATQALVESVLISGRA